MGSGGTKAPGTDTIIQRAAEQRNLPALFAALPLLRDIGDAHLREITDEIEWFSLPGGATLFTAGQAADGVGPELDAQPPPGDGEVGVQAAALRHVADECPD